MAKSIVPKLQTSPGDPPIESDRARNRESFFTESLSLIRKVVVGRRVVHTDDLPDVSQEIALRLWKWFRKFDEKSSGMPVSEWRSFTARAAHNEVNRKLSNQSKRPEVSLDEVGSEGPVFGETSPEVILLVEIVWQGICRLTLYQRQALLLSSLDLVIYLLQFGVEENDLIDVLGLSTQSWEKIIPRMPLSDNEIGELLSARSGREKFASNPGAVKKARFDARRRLKELMDK